MISEIIRANALHIPLRDASVQCCVTSPPYWGLRDYGLEPTIWGGDAECAHVWGDDIPGSNRGGSGTPTDKNNRGEGYARGEARESERFNAAAVAALGWLEVNHIMGPVKDNLRAALAATPEPPIEGPQWPPQPGDTVIVEGVVTKCKESEGAPGDYNVTVAFGGSGAMPIAGEFVTIVSRPAPKHTCRDCRWFCTCGHMVYGCSYPEYAPKHHDPNHAICGFFERWPG